MVVTPIMVLLEKSYAIGLAAPSRIFQQHPTRAQCLGLRACASDLIPVPGLINWTLMEMPPRFGGWPTVHMGAPGVRSSLSLGRWQGLGKRGQVRRLRSQDVGFELGNRAIITFEWRGRPAPVPTMGRLGP